MRKFFLLFSILSTALFFSGCGDNITDPNVYVLKSATSAAEGNWEKALGLAEKAVDMNPENVQAQVMYSMALDQNGQQLEAIKYLQKAIKTEPNNFLAQLTLGRLLYDKGDYEGSYDKLANAYNLNPDNVDALILYSECSEKILAQNTDELLNKLSTTKAYKGKPIIFNELGVYYARVYNVGNAIRNLAKAYKLNPDNPIINFNLGVLCDRYISNPEKAKDFYKKFLTLTKDNPAYNKQRDEVINRLKAI